ncbi:MAG: TAT-variant-translocated molybdopterin oxidoreductase [Candidatus Marinimicrobia bacterium]|nr:TAT-variant-translocated molybdopterin oxidoreductase [Candidatus Neomarinimicrobiota bacterium]MCF7840474.1 TAT-variant-translocated molybdopterin oxidoreductase [Candidatus Neomarinimicrobiota bacterium]MCF7903311.1 TAT-variant-translocated molybdopterin oxidoreductase [Candidatus Neomarinimicrobiota bacterium]
MSRIKALQQTTPAGDKAYWASLDQIENTPEFQQMVQREFPEGASELNDPMSRRRFINLMGASMALAGLVSCRRPVEKIIPYVVQPEEVTPGVLQRYATTMPFGLSAYGVTVESHEGRPTKVDGNQLHPATEGSANAFMQASILGLYDPDRSQLVQHNGRSATWDEFVAAWRKLYEDYKRTGGKGLALLSESFASPTLYRLKKDFEKTFPNATWVTYEPVSDENIFAGIEAATGQTQMPVHDYAKAEVVLSLDSDFLLMESENLTASRGFSNRRRVEKETDKMNRLYVVEPAFTITGGMADHRLRLQARQVGAFTAALAVELRKLGLDVADESTLGDYANHNFDKRWLRALARDLFNNRGKGLIVAGRRQPAAVHALVFALNRALGNVGKTVAYRNFKDAAAPSTKSLTELTGFLQKGAVETLVILGGNPAYSAPADLALDKALGKAKHVIHLGHGMDETGGLAEWHLPQSHYLESWGDARSADGTLSVIQPLIDPLFDSRNAIEVLALINTGSLPKAYELVRETWRSLVNGAFEAEWRRVLHDGVLAGSAVKGSRPALSRNFSAYLKNNPFPADSADPANMEVVFTASTHTWDGRFANIGWLQELPDPNTKLTWDNAALMSHSTAEKLGVKNEDLVSLNLDGRQVSLPVWIMPGQADWTVVVALGFGRTKAGRIGNYVGQNTFQLRTSKALHFAAGLTVTPTKGTYALACTQDFHGMDAEKLASGAIQKRLPTIFKEATLDQYRAQPDFAEQKLEFPNNSMWEDWKYDTGYQWGMSIDLNVCTGCNACAIACQSENNIPVVGKAQVAKGREMHWLRLDRYYSGDLDAPEMVFEPVGCQHCEMAPCEQVCPVAATSHDEEGLNVMTYNRCVGTRYCSNNCPYKVRRFNFFNYTKDTPEVVQMAMNPDVTVRFRGVMEKCTYCLQRINRGKQMAKKENRTLRDGEVVSACQQTCPTDAIVFGNINDPESRVSQLKNQNRDFGLLAELNTRPRTSYLAKLRNPNPQLELPIHQG